MKNYYNILQKLYVKSYQKDKWDIRKIKIIQKELGYPDSKFKTVHVAGTNGKGSVSFKTANSLYKSGYKVGLFSSPHISSFRERIVINNKIISKKDVVKGTSLIFSLCSEHNVDLSFFEIVTLLCFWYFAKNKVDIAIIETGLGGRLDATNIITPIVTVITSISFEHTQYLGVSLDDIAKEKSGIIKENVPLVLGPNANLSVIKEIAKIKNSYVEQVFSKDSFYDDINIKIAKAVLSLLVNNGYNIDFDNIKDIIKKRPKCRFEVFTNKNTVGKLFQYFPKAVVLDVAHNKEAFISIKKALKSKYNVDKVRTILGISQDKDIEGCLDVIISFSSHIYCVEANSERSLPKERLYHYLLDEGYTSISMKKNINETVYSAITDADKNSELLLICGSFFIMDDVRKALDIKVERDNFELNEKL